MPLADRSLRAHLRDNGPLSADETVRILTDVATALVDLGGGIVHRDIKPENVLLLNGYWCLSDFGIARYAEASTAADTHKYAWTKAYNAPERWRGERATPASDIYSFGIMAFEMLAGPLPFPGPEFRDQHLHDTAPRLSDCPTPLVSLVAQCIAKAAEVRPSAADVLAQLGIVNGTPSAAAGRLQAANEMQVRQVAGAVAAQSATRSAAERRQRMAASAADVLAQVAEGLAKLVRDNAPAAEWRLCRPPSLLASEVALGQAILRLSDVHQLRSDQWGRWPPAFEVLAYASVGVHMPADGRHYEGRSHSLWFCDAQQRDVFHWYETAFFASALYDSPSTRERHRLEPFALEPDEDAGAALSEASFTHFEVAWPFGVVGRGDDNEFLERWIEWFARAAVGDLTHPSYMPERQAVGSFRRNMSP